MGSTTVDRNEEVHGGRRWLNIALLILSQGSQTVVLSATALFLPLIQTELGISYTQAGAFAAANTIAYAAMQIPAGYLADRFGARRVFLTGLVGTNCLALLLTLLTDYRLMVADQMAIGVFRALLFVPGLVLVGHLFPPTRRSTAMGLFVMGTVLTTFTLSTFGPYLVEPIGWRAIVAVLSVAGAAVALAMWRIGATGPEGQGRGATTPTGILRLFRRPEMLAVAGIQFVRLFVFQGMGFWLPTLLVTEKGLSLQEAGAVVAMSALITAPSNFVGGFISDRLGRPVLVVGVAVATLAVSIVALVVVTDVAGLLVAVAVYSAVVQLYFGPLFSIPIAILGPSVAGVASGFGNLFANLGTFVSVLVLGLLKDQTGRFDVGLYVLAAACLVSLALIVGLARAVHVLMVPQAETSSTARALGTEADPT